MSGISDVGNQSYTYKPVGTLETQTDARGCITNLVHDPFNRLAGKTYYGTCSGNAVSYVYDIGQHTIGNRTSMTDTQNPASWSYDARGRLVAETRSVYEVSGSFRTEWGYNSAGLLKWMKYPAGNNGQVGEQVNYAYHPQMSLNTVLSDFPYAYVDSTSYDQAGRVKQRTLGGTTNQVQTQYNYYPWDTQGGRLEWIKSGTPSTQPAEPTKFQYFTYEYDEVGNIEEIGDYKLGDPQTGVPQLQSFGYDNLYRLTSAGASGGYQGAGNYGPENYSYESTTGRMASKNSVSYTYNSGHFHAVSSLSNGSTYSYDANGNMTYRHVYEGGVWKNYTLVYDAENRLATVTGPVTANFKYDGDSKRIRATINGGLDTVFIGNYFEWNVATQTKRTYYYAGATRIAMREGSGDPQWILGDHLGSTSKMVSYLGADTGGQWYKAWGETRLQTGTIPTKYQYTGQYNQVIIGLYFYNSRWYDPNLGRFTQPDNIIPGPANSQSWDRFSYVLNNPLKYTDPSGHDPHWCEGSAWSSSCELRYYYAMSPDPKPVVDDYLQAYDISAPSDLIDSQKYASAMAAAIKGDYFFWTYGSQYGFDSPFDAFLKTHGLINILIDSNRTDCQTVQHTISCGPNAITLGTIMHEYFHVMDKYYAESVTAQEWCKYPDGLGCMASNWLPGDYSSSFTYTISAYNCPTCLAHPPTLFGYDFTEAFANAGETWVLSASGVDPTGGFANNTYGNDVSVWMTDKMTFFLNSMFR